MRIPHRTLVLVTDGRKLLLLRNEGDAAYPDLRALLKRVDDNPPAHAQGSDAPGRTFSSRLGGAGRSAYGGTDLHERRETAFAIEAAALLDAQVAAADGASLIVVAPPRTLGELRAHYREAVRQSLLGEIDKDLVKHPIAEIARIIGQT